MQNTHWPSASVLVVADKQLPCGPGQPKLQMGHKLKILHGPKGNQISIDGISVHSIYNFFLYGIL